MLLAVCAAVLVAPLYWTLVPVRWRRPALTLASLAALGAYDWRLLVLLPATTLLVVGGVRVAEAGPATLRARLVVAGALAALLVLFVWNKAGGPGGVSGTLASQQGLAFLGVSYLVLKASAVLLDATAGARSGATVAGVLGWLAFAPTYPAGPIERWERFAAQAPRFDRAQVLAGAERILFGLVKALVLGRHLGVWADGVLAAPAAHDRLTLLAGAYAQSLRFYLDFAGYSDVAIGLAALYGIRVSENFDGPLWRRNYVQLWQRWHMTLTGWLRLYVFFPASRWLVRRAGPTHATIPIVAAQIATMTACGLWHGLAWNFALWGLLQALGLLWVGVAARPLGRRLPPPVVRWWRTSLIAHGLAVWLTFTTFSLTVLFVVTDTGGAVRYLGLLAGVTG